MNYSKPIINIKNDYQYLTTNMMDYNGADKKIYTIKFTRPTYGES